MLFNERLREAMELRNIKQVDLVKETGISKSGISQYLSGDFAAKQDKVFLLAKALRVDPAWLMGKDKTRRGGRKHNKRYCNYYKQQMGTIRCG